MAFLNSLTANTSKKDEMFINTHILKMQLITKCYEFISFFVCSDLIINLYQER